MKFENIEGSIDRQNLCSTTPDNSDDVVEEGLILQFLANEYHDIVGWDSKLLDCLFGGGRGKSHTFDKGSTILNGTFKLDIGGYKFKGQQFSSATIGMVKKVGSVIKLHVTLPYSEEFHTFISKNFRKMIKISIIEINEQKTVPQPE